MKDHIYAENNKIALKLARISIPVQTFPLPEYPDSHEQLYEPTLLIQFALVWHLGVPSAHSLIS